MDIYTIQIAKRSKLPMDIEFIDATRKSGDLRLAPTWNMVMGVKDHIAAHCNPEIGVSIADFRRQYRDIIQQSIMDDRPFWEALVQKEKIAIACYCSLETNKIKFCHRLLLKEYLLHLCHLKQIPSTDCGEIT